MAQGFIGLSIEYYAVEHYAGKDPAALNPVFPQVIRNLAPGQSPVLRIGGDSADRAWVRSPRWRDRLAQKSPSHRIS